MKFRGRPPFFRDSESLAKKIEEYFENPPKRKVTDNEGKTVEVPELTATGLALYLGFASRQSLYDYEHRGDDFAYVIKRARSFIENEYEKLLTTKCVTGAIFALKQFGWHDRIENTMLGPDGGAVQHDHVIEFVGVSGDTENTDSD